jgi:hypothetical protein
MSGRFSKRHKRCIREKDNKLSKEIMAKRIIQYCLLGPSVIVLIIFVIGILREDPLSPGILEVFFSKISVSCVSSCKRVYKVKIHSLNSFNLNDSSRGRQFDFILSLEFGIILHLLRVHSVRRSCIVSDQVVLSYG